MGGCIRKCFAATAMVYSCLMQNTYTPGTGSTSYTVAPQAVQAFVLITGGWLLYPLDTVQPCIVLQLYLLAGVPNQQLILSGICSNLMHECCMCVCEAPLNDSATKQIRSGVLWDASLVEWRTPMSQTCSLRLAQPARFSGLSKHSCCHVRWQRSHQLQHLRAAVPHGRRPRWAMGHLHQPDQPRHTRGCGADVHRQLGAEPISVHRFVSQQLSCACI